MSRSSTVLVTGATGYLGSWLVMRLLQGGYRVKASVLDKDDKKDLEPLLSLSPSLAENLEIVEGNILRDGDFDSHVEGCEGVFHLAFNVVFDVAEADIQKKMIEPAVQGSVNVLKSCANSSTVKRIVYASSCAAALNCDPSQKILDESCWTDIDASKKYAGWLYAVAKTLGEQAAAEFAKENKLDLVVINPAFVVGPYLLPKIPSSTFLMKSFFIGNNSVLTMSRYSIPVVHTDDVARAFIFLYETPESNGRYMCGNAGISAVHFVDAIRARLPAGMDGIKTTNEEENSNNGSNSKDEGIVCGLDSSKLQSLGFQYHYTDKDMINDFINCTLGKSLTLHQLLHD